MEVSFLLKYKHFLEL